MSHISHPLFPVLKHSRRKPRKGSRLGFGISKGSMGLVYLLTNVLMYQKDQANEEKYTIHGSYGNVQSFSCSFF